MKKALLLLALITVDFSLFSHTRNHSPIDIQYVKPSYDETMSRFLALEFTEKNLILFIGFLELPKACIYQARIETANYTSNLFINHNNLFGMHLPYIRKSTANGYVNADNSKVSTYVSWQQSVLDFRLYLEYWISKGYDISDYYDFLTKVGYCELPDYTQNLQAFKK